MKFKRSDYENETLPRPHNTKFHVAYIYNFKGQLLCRETNRIASRSRGAGCSEYTIHAERAALKSVGNFTLLRGATLVVVRFGIEGNLLPSKPCHDCSCHLTKAIRSYGLRSVYYS
jgi:hypothetical protein